MEEKYRYDYFDPDYKDLSTLNYEIFERNHYFVAKNEYLRCHNRYLKSFGNYKELKKELDSPDIGMICKKELDNLRKVANNGLTYKEICGRVKVYITTDFFQKPLKKK
jgi:hypothetical protein